MQGRHVSAGGRRQQANAQPGAASQAAAAAAAARTVTPAFASFSLSSFCFCSAALARAQLLQVDPELGGGLGGGCSPVAAPPRAAAWRLPPRRPPHPPLCASRPVGSRPTPSARDECGGRHLCQGALTASAIAEMSRAGEERCDRRARQGQEPHTYCHARRHGRSARCRAFAGRPPASPACGGVRCRVCVPNVRHADVAGVSAPKAPTMRPALTRLQLLSHAVTAPAVCCDVAGHAAPAEARKNGDKIDSGLGERPNEWAAGGSAALGAQRITWCKRDQQGGRDLGETLSM